MGAQKKCLIALLNQELGSTLVFTEEKVDADWLCGVLEKDGHPVVNISDRSQSERTSASLVRRGSLGYSWPRYRVARYECPWDRAYNQFRYTADCGGPFIVREERRMNSKGMVSTIASWLERDMVSKIESTLGKEIPRCSVPGVEPYVETKPAQKGGRRRPSRW